MTAVATALASAPFWLPRAVLEVRETLFKRINGVEGIPVPGPAIPVSNFRALYAHPAANGRSRGAALSDLFWYWLSPGAELHQEHLEPGPEYEAVARTTRQFLAIPNARAEELAAACLSAVCKPLGAKDLASVRLRDLMMPVWARFYYELVFGFPCPPEAESLIIANANDVVTALKCVSLRHMGKRNALTVYLEQTLRMHGAVHALPDFFSPQQQALYLQGVFFNTAIVQMSEAMTHLIFAVAQHPELETDLLAHLQEDRYLDHLIAETLRKYPLFGIAHRITSEEIALDDASNIPRGSVLCFHYADYQNSGFDDPERFDPARWKTVSAKSATYIPFGVTANRPCPAQAIALVTMRAAGREFFRRFHCASSAAHTRSIPNRGPCLLVPRDKTPRQGRIRSALICMAWRDRVEDVTRSLRQLVLGTIMVLHARKLRLCQHHFAGKACPFPGSGRA
jgi:hypothetical protein